MYPIITNLQTVLDWLESAFCHLRETHPDRPELVGKNLSTTQQNEKQQVSHEPTLTGIPRVGNVQNGFVHDVAVLQVPYHTFLLLIPHLNTVDLIFFPFEPN